MAAGAGLFSDLLTDPSSGLIPYWNGLVRMGVFLILAALLATLKSSIELQREVAMHEHDVSEQLRDLNELKNTLLHAVSHDLKGPIAAVLGAVSTLRRGEQLQLTDEQRESLFEVIEMSGRKTNRLLNDLLDLDRIDRGLLHLDRQATDVGALANRVMRECEALAAHPVRVDADRVLVEVDPTMVERVIENLLVNAARHTPLGTPVRVNVRGRTDGIELSVEDEGPGIPDDLKLVLFDSFRQGPGSNGGGVGIGLSLVKRFAELHGGTARVEDHPGGGARFVVALPGRVTQRDALTAEQSSLRAV
jgi:signal transduction histidine kinase